MIDITTSISPIEREYPSGISIEKWVGSIAIKGGVDGSILHYPIEGESPKNIVKTQICALKSMKVAIEKRIKLLESSLRD
jgi:hypothetical protein